MDEWKRDCHLSNFRIGFLRVSVQNYNLPIDDARLVLRNFKDKKNAKFVADDISALEGKPFPSAKKSTDWYLANLAAHHGMKWATLDSNAKHPAAELIS